jgi:hypothetical protein
MEQHDQLPGWRPGGEGVEDQPRGRQLERFDHLLRSPAGRSVCRSTLNLTAESRPELNREPLAAEREPEDHRARWRAIALAGEPPDQAVGTERPGCCSGHP